MAKRFIDTDIFKKQFIRGLDAPCKLLWFYILNDCNHAGIWEVDFEIAQIRLGIKLNQQKVLSAFNEKIQELDGGSKWFIQDFIEFQYGHLNEKNRVHSSIISILMRHNLLNDDFSIKGLDKGLTSPMEGDKDKDKDKDMDKDKDKEGKKPKRKDHLFSDSEFYDFEKFSEKFIGTEYVVCDLRIYYEKVKNWSASKGSKRIDWIATAINFILKDRDDKKLILKQGYEQSNTKQSEFGAAIDDYYSRKGRN